jgi:hypothetical protein
MALRETRFDSLQGELERLGCQEVRVTHVGADEQVLFARRDEAISCSYALARHILTRLQSFCGDQEVWEALEKVGRPGFL